MLDEIETLMKYEIITPRRKKVRSIFLKFLLAPTYGASGQITKQRVSSIFILENHETRTSSKTYLEKIQKFFKKASWKHLEDKQRHENILDVSRRLDSNYSFGQLYKDMFD